MFPQFSRLVLTTTVATLLFALSAKAEAPIYVRVALVIGNAAYVSAPKLVNPSNDAKAISQVLRSQGFTVIELVNGTRGQMQSGIAKIRDSLRGQNGIGMLYYAGHGLQLNDRNFMVPVDAKIKTRSDVLQQTVDIGEAIDAFKTAGNRMNIVVLDACRDNPFAQASTQQGLAPMDAPVGTFLAFATAPGNVAEDGDEKSINGLYTSFLLQEMKRPQARIEDVFKRVRYLVRQKSEGRQVPWESTSLEEDFYFSDGKIAAPVKFTPEIAKSAYEIELAEWKKIGNSRDVNDFYAFLQKHPDSALTLSAQGKIDDLARTKLIVQGGGADGGNALLSLQPYKKGQRWSMTSTLSSGGRITRRNSSEVKVADCDTAGCTVEESLSAENGTHKFIERYSPSGGLLSRDSSIKGASHVNDAPVYLVPPGLLQIGQRWKSVTITKNNHGLLFVVSREGRVVSREPITTSAGTFDTFKIEVTRHGKGGGYETSQSLTYWMTPALPVAVRYIERQDIAGAPNGFFIETTNELVQYAER